ASTTAPRSWRIPPPSPRAPRTTTASCSSARPPSSPGRRVELPAALTPLADDAAHAAIVTDFDGTLAPIVDDPDDARALPAARDALARCVPLVARVAVVSGRPVSFLARALGVAGVERVGVYGLERVVDGEVVADQRAV